MTTTPQRARTPRQVRQQTARRKAERRRVVMRGGAAVVFGLVLAIVVTVLAAARGGDGPSSRAVVVPANATADGIIRVGRDDAPVTVSVYFDYMCPFCGRFEEANNSELRKLMAEAQVRVELRPLSFLDPQSRGSQFSTRSANALATVADGAPAQVWDFHRTLFAHQPEEGTAGPTDADIADMARQAGVPDAVSARFEEQLFAGWVADVTRQALAAGVTGTPSVLVDGAVFRGDLFTRGPLTEAVRAAVAGG